MLKVELTAITPNAELHCEKAARDCYDSIKSMKPGGSKLVSGCIKKGHLSILCHASASFRISGVSRALTHQLVRQRTAGFSQKSQRYVKENGFSFVSPHTIKQNTQAHVAYQKCMGDLANYYKILIDLGIPKEDARFVLPNACDTTINCTMSFEGYIHFFRNRLDKHAQWEIRDMATEMWRILKKEAPKVFNKDCLEAVPVRTYDWSKLDA